jgi:hypothetical protein
VCCGSLWASPRGLDPKPPFDVSLRMSEVRPVFDGRGRHDKNAIPTTGSRHVGEGTLIKPEYRQRIGYSPNPE